MQSGAQIQAAPQILPAMAHATLGPEEALVYVIVNLGCSACHIVQGGVVSVLRTIQVKSALLHNT